MALRADPALDGSGFRRRRRRNLRGKHADVQGLHALLVPCDERFPLALESSQAVVEGLGLGRGGRRSGRLALRRRRCAHRSGAGGASSAARRARSRRGRLSLDLRLAEFDLRDGDVRGAGFPRAFLRAGVGVVVDAERREHGGAVLVVEIGESSDIRDGEVVDGVQNRTQRVAHALHVVEGLVIFAAQREARVALGERLVRGLALASLRGRHLEETRV